LFLGNAIGRDIEQRGRKPIQLKEDDEESPNFYRWQFSEDYPRFPKGAVATWSSTQHEDCLDALNEGWLSVLDLAPPSSRSPPIEMEEELFEDNGFSERQPRLSKENSPENAQNAIDTSNILSTIRYHDLGKIVLSLAEDAKSSDDILNLQKVYIEVQGLIQKKEIAVQDVGERLKTQMRSLSSIRGEIVNHAHTKILDLEKTVKNERFQYQQLKSDSEELQEELCRASEEICDLKQRLECTLGEVSESRRRAELEDLRTSIQDLREERDAQFHRHLTQLQKARDGVWEDGYRKCEAGTMSKVYPSVIIADIKRQMENLQTRSSVELSESREEVSKLKQQLKDMQARHSAEVAKAKEQGRREDEELSYLLEDHNVKSVRKACSSRTPKE
jgi:predicted  nucleic acid-binding Zn-ribbon protein